VFHEEHAATGHVGSTIHPVDLWCVDNTMGTFMARASSDVEVSGIQGRDVRSPLGVTPAGLVASGAADPAPAAVPATAKIDSARAPAEEEVVPHAIAPRLQLISSPQRLFHKFQAARSRKRSEGVRRAVTPAIVDFRRIWSDGGAFTDGQGLTAWRPVAPPGYSALGDCIVKGFDPPASALVVLDSGAGISAGNERTQEKTPLVKAPRGFDLIWHDGNPKEELRACFWRLIPPPGYVAMGCVASIGAVAPKRGIKCLRADAAAPSPSPPRSPLWSTGRSDKAVPPLSVWAVDEALCTFVVEPSDRLVPPTERWRIKVPEPIDLGGADDIPQHENHEAEGVNIIVRSGPMSLLLLDSLNTPLLEIETNGVEAGVRGPSRQVVQAYLGVRPGVFAFNRPLRHWEPVLEPVDIIAKCDANFGAKSSAGIDPGVALSVKSSAEMVYTTMSLAHTNALLSAISEWHVLHQQSHTRQLAALLRADATGIRTTVVNALGVDAAMELDFGGHLCVSLT